MITFYIAMNKQQLRKEIKQQRNQLSVEYIKQKSKRIKNTLFSLEIFHSASTILFYVSYGKEVDTHEMIKDCLSLNKTVIIPKSLPDSQTLLLSKIQNWDDLEKGCYDILEPKPSQIQEVSSTALDLIIVPGIVFDIHKNRIGHGKGYYDKLLYSNQNIPTIGLAFECQIVDQINTEEHDIKIDMIITEKRILS